MESDFRVLRPGEISSLSVGGFALDVLEGLSAMPKRIPSVYFYDERGSDLFKEISRLEEYYLTDCEVEILKTHGESLAGLFRDRPFNLLELGAGDGRKTVILLEHLLTQRLSVDYMPLDVSEGAMKDLIDFMRSKLSRSTLKITGLVGEYFDALKWLNRKNGRRNITLFLGSSIGNFKKASARRFLHHLWSSSSQGDFLLIGFDLKKDIAVMERAYNDSQGVTKEFNLNLLDRINRELGGNFDREKFAFCSRYNPSSGAVESWLVSRKAQQVRLEKLERSFDFDAWEGVHTEDSHKFSVPEIEDLAARTGFTVVEQFFDSRKYFVDSLWRVEKG